MSKLLYTIAAFTLAFAIAAHAQPTCYFPLNASAPPLGQTWYDNNGVAYSPFTPGSWPWEIYTSSIASPPSTPPEPYVLHTNPGQGQGHYNSPVWLTSPQLTSFNWQYNKLIWSFWMGRGQGVGQNGGGNDGSVVWLYVNQRTNLNSPNTPGQEGIKLMWHHFNNQDNLRLSEVYNGVEHVIKDIVLIQNLNLYEWGLGVYIERIPGGYPTGAAITYKVYLTTPDPTHPSYATSSVPADIDAAQTVNSGFLRIDTTLTSPWTPLSANGYIGLYSFFAGAGNNKKLAAEYNQVCFTDAGPAPVELSSFTADYRNDLVNLNWSTATELNNYGFEIQRSVEHNGEWETIGFVEGNGTSDSPKNYSFNDAPNADGASMIAYRLKQVDRDGSFEYSNTILVTIAPKSSDVLYNFPNPFNPSTNITFNLLADDVVNLKVYNSAGEMVTELYDNVEMNAGYHTASFSGKGLPSGTYFYRLTTSTGTKTNSMVLSK